MNNFQIRLLAFTLSFLGFLFIRNYFVQYTGVLPLNQQIASSNFLPVRDTVQAWEGSMDVDQSTLSDLSITDPVLMWEGQKEEQEKKEEFSENQLEQEASPPEEIQENLETEALEFEDETRPVNPEMVVYLTFDDGPSSYTDEILDVLKEYNVKATFFMLEPRIRKYPDIVIRMRDEDHALGSHSVTHKIQEFYKSTEQMIWEMNATAQAIKDISDVDTPLIRVPYGSVPHMTKAQKTIMTEQGFKIWDWNVDSRDWKFTNGEYIAHTISQLEKLRNKKNAPVILLHDLHTTALYLPRLLSYLKTQGYEFRVLNPSMQEVQF